MSEHVDIVEAAGAAEPVGAYPHARRAGDLLFLSGIGPRVRGERSIPGVVLDAAGSSWDRLVDITVFLTNIERDFDTYNRVYAEYFPGPVRPCRTTVEVRRLPTPIAIELKCVATI